MQNSWEHAWANAQTTLSSIKHSLISGTHSDPRIIRVGQLDSELLDQELVSLLKEPLKQALALISTSLRARFEPELTLFIQLTLYKLSVWNAGASYGAKLQDLRYSVPSGKHHSLTPSGLPKQTLLIHGSLIILIPYFHNRLRIHGLSQAWPDAPSSDWRRKAWNIMVNLESAYMAMGLISFVAFLWDGRYRTIVERILHMSLIPSRRLVKRDVSYEFMNRQMVWHGFTEFLLFLLPLLGARTIRRSIAKLTSRLNLSSILPAMVHSVLGIPDSTETIPLAPGQSKRGKYWSLTRDQCAICAENASLSLNLSEPTNALTALTFTSTSGLEASTSDDQNISGSGLSSEPPTHPLHTPYITSCEHIYCYHCLSERMMRCADDGVDGWECLRCGDNVRSSERWTGDITLGISDRNDWDDGFSSLSNFESGTDLSASGSLGYSISESEYSS